MSPKKWRNGRLDSSRQVAAQVLSAGFATHEEIRLSIVFGVVTLVANRSVWVCYDSIDWRMSTEMCIWCHARWDPEIKGPLCRECVGLIQDISDSHYKILVRYMWSLCFTCCVLKCACYLLETQKATLQRTHFVSCWHRNEKLIWQSLHRWASWMYMMET